MLFCQKLDLAKSGTANKSPIGIFDQMVDCVVGNLDRLAVPGPMLGRHQPPDLGVDLAAP